MILPARGKARRELHGGAKKEKTVPACGLIARLECVSKPTLCLLIRLSPADEQNVLSRLSWVEKSSPELHKQQQCINKHSDE